MQDLKKLLNNDKDICGVLVEPIQCTFGDRYFPPEFFFEIRNLCDEYDIPLIFDEIQTGFCATGEIWYYQKIGIEPDILIFGKKTQLSGIMVKEKFAEIFKKPIRLEVTWDADVTDMVRCKYIIKAMKNENVLSNVDKMSKKLFKNLSAIKNIYNLRNAGLICAFDLKNEKTKNIFVKKLIKEKMLFNPTRNKTIRLRPNLLVSEKEINHASEKIEEVLKKIN